MQSQSPRCGLIFNLRQELASARGVCESLRQRNAALVLQLARRSETIAVEAKSEHGLTIALVDAVATIATLIGGRDTSHPEVRAALADLGSDDDAGQLFNTAIDAAYHDGPKPDAWLES